MPKLTIVTVTFNDLDGLTHTRASVVDAKGIDLEHVIIDGGSKDGTVDYLARLPDGVRWVSEKDRGPYDAMNKGAALARGEWVMFLNSGDTLAEQSILGNLLTAADCSDAGLAYGDVKGWLRGHPCHQAVIARRRLLLEMPFDLGFRIAADFHWMEKVRGRGEKSLKVDGPVCVYQPGGLSSRSFLRCTIEWWKVVKLAGGSSARCKAFFLKSLRKHGRRKRRTYLLKKIRGLLGL